MRIRFAWAPPAAALAVLILGLRAFLREYPRASVPGPRGPGFGGALSATRHFQPESLDAGIADDSAPSPDPFRLRPAASHPAGPRAPLPPPARKWTLKGTAGDAVATVLDSVGGKHLLRVGDSLGGARVLEVHAQRVRMRDAAGDFELELEP